MFFQLFKEIGGVVNMKEKKVRSTICTEDDDYCRNFMEGQGRWVVTLDTGEAVYQDDFRYGPDDRAWTRLKEHCLTTGSKIVGMLLQFRSHRVQLPADKAGYFFCRMARGDFGAKKTRQFYLTGCLENGIIELTKWDVPSLLPTFYERRPLTKVDDECYIGENTVTKG